MESSTHRPIWLGQAQIPGNMANILTAIGIPVSEGQGYAGVISSVQINDYRNVLDNIETVNDIMQIPSGDQIRLIPPHPLRPLARSTNVCVNGRQERCALSLLRNGFALNLAGSASGGPGVTSFWTIATAVLWLGGGAGVIGVTIYTLRGRRHGKLHY